jgi:hypothetical protein
MSCNMPQDISHASGYFYTPQASVLRRGIRRLRPRTPQASATPETTMPLAPMTAQAQTVGSHGLVTRNTPAVIPPARNAIARGGATVPAHGARSLGVAEPRHVQHQVGRGAQGALTSAPPPPLMALVFGAPRPAPPYGALVFGAARPGRPGAPANPVQHARASVAAAGPGGSTSPGAAQWHSRGRPLPRRSCRRRPRQG